MSKLAAHTAWYTLGNLIPRISNFLLLPLYSAFLSPADYGIISAMLTLQMVMLPICTLALDRGLERLFFDSDDPGERKRIVSTISIMILVFAAAILGGGVAGRRYLVKIFPDIPFLPYYAMMLGILALDMFTIVPKVYWRVNQRAKLFVAVSFLQFAVLLVLKLVFIVGLRQGARGFMTANLLAFAVMTPFFIWWMLRIADFRFDFRIAAGALVFSLPMIPLLLSGWIVQLTSRMFIDRNINMNALGIYSFSMTLASVLQMIGVSYLPAYSPVFYAAANGGDQRTAKRELFEYNRNYMLFLIFLSFCQALFMRNVLMCLNQRYLECWKYIPLMTLGIFFNLIGGIYNLCFYQSKNSVWVMLLFFLSAAVNILLTWLMIKPCGVWGCVWAGVFSNILLFALTYLLAHRYFFIPLDWLLLITVGGGAIAINALFYFAELKFAVDLVCKIVCCLIVAAALLRWKGEFFNRLLPHAITGSGIWKIIYGWATVNMAKKAS